MNKDNLKIKVGAYIGISKAQKNLGEGKVVVTWIDKLVGLVKGVRR